jgi:UDP-glucuronate 4-epimerase
VARRILITGAPGFIGTHLSTRLLQNGDHVVGLDNFDPFYDVAIKHRNLERLRELGGAAFSLIEGDLRDADACAAAVDGVDGVVHLAALAGVRPSIQNPVRYMDVNVRGTQILLDAWQAVAAGTGKPFVFGSSSSVYGGNEKVPFAEDDPVDHPVSPYAASKRAGELICSTFHHLSGLPMTCLRFFTVFGPGQRPEMAIHKFARKIMAGEPLPFFGDGSSRRDYTFVADIVDGVTAALYRDPAVSGGYRIYNLGGAETTTLEELVRLIETTLGKAAVLDRQPDQPGDVPATFADVTRAGAELGYERRVPLAAGLRRFAEWYLSERDAGRLA